MDASTLTVNARAARGLLLILALALAFRLIYTLAQNPLAPYTNDGSDSAWYLSTGYSLALGDVFDHLPPAPLYLLLIGTAQRVLSPAGAIIAVRLLQVVLAGATCYFAYRMAARLSHDPRAGLLAALVLAISPAFIVETSHITTETVYIFFLAAGMTLYVEVIARDLTAPRRLAVGLAGAGALFALATLTRAVPLVFPVGLALHLVLAYGWRAGLKRAVPLLVAYTLMVSTWTVYNVVRFNRFVVGAEGLAAFLYLGTTDWTNPTEVDIQLAEDASEAPAIDATLDERQGAYVDAAGNVISRDPVGYVRRRVGELAGAYLQPYGTAFFPGESLRELGARWLRDDRTPGGLLAVAQGDAFFPKLAIYLLHFTGLLAGLVGMWHTRHRWRLTLPLIGFIAYTSLVHLVLLALPRYIFPTEVFWWVFAAAGLIALTRPQPAPALPVQPAAPHAAKGTTRP